MSACSSLSDNNTVILISPDGSKFEISVEIADEDHERKQGLMFREDLEEGTGMLFVFDSQRPLSFWMKNTRMPLDILFFDDEGRFISWSAMQPCTQDSCERYTSDTPGKYALEVPLGTAESLNIGQGWRILVE